MDKIEQLEKRINSLETRFKNTEDYALYNTAIGVPKYTDILSLGAGRYRGNYFINAPHELDPTAVAIVTVVVAPDARTIIVKQNYINRYWVRSIHSGGNAELGWASVDTRRLLWHGSLTTLNKPTPWFDDAGVPNINGTCYEIGWESAMWGQSGTQRTNSYYSAIIELMNHSNINPDNPTDASSIQRNTLEAYVLIDRANKTFTLRGPFTGMNSFATGNVPVIYGSDKQEEQNFIKITDIWELTSNYNDANYIDKLTTTTTTTK